MKSVGEAMAIGRTFRESFAKAMRSRELDASRTSPARRRSCWPGSRRPRPTASTSARGLSPRRRIDGRDAGPRSIRGSCASLRPAVDGDGTDGLERAYRSVDTCAAEFEARTPYYYSAHERKAPLQGEVRRGDRDSVVILGSGPNRIGQGIEFDYCCVHAAMTVRESGRDAVMINCNPRRSRPTTTPPTASTSSP